MPEQDDSRAEPPRLAKRGAILDVNDSIRDAALRIGAPESDALWEFICECGAPDCHAMLTLTLAQYEALRDDGAPLLIDGHDPNRPAKARREATERSEEAQALRAQAKLQHRRARRNVDSRRDG